VRILDNLILLEHLLVVIQVQELLLPKVDILGPDHQVKDILVHHLLKEATLALHLHKEAIQGLHLKVMDIQVADHQHQEVIPVKTMEEHHHQTKDMEEQEDHHLAVDMVGHHLKVKVMVVHHPRDKDMVVVIPLVKLLLTLRCSNGSMLLIQTEADK